MSSLFMLIISKDTAGQEKYRALAPMYYRDAAGIYYLCIVISKGLY